MPKSKAHPLDSLTFTAPKLEEAQTPLSATTPASGDPRRAMRVATVTGAAAIPLAPADAPADPGTELEGKGGAEGETRSSNVTLPVTVWEWIDRKHAEARTAGGRPLRKAAIIRAVFEVAMQTEVNLAGVQSDEEIAARLLRALRG
jgi:hypothetical protein